MITPSSIGRAAYEAYCASRDNKAWDGSPLPVWKDVKPEIKVGWIEGALAVAKQLDADFKFLGTEQ